VAVEETVAAMEVVEEKEVIKLEIENKEKEWEVSNRR
jgi:hypothetical protein